MSGRSCRISSWKSLSKPVEIQKISNACWGRPRRSSISVSGGNNICNIILWSGKALFNILGIINVQRELWWQLIFASQIIFFLAWIVVSPDKVIIHLCTYLHYRAVGRSENLGGYVSSNMVGIICPLVRIGLIDFPKSVREIAPLHCPLASYDPTLTLLTNEHHLINDP